MTIRGFISIYESQALNQAHRLYGWATMNDAALRADEIAAGFAQTVKGKRVDNAGA